MSVLVERISVMFKKPRKLFKNNHRAKNGYTDWLLD